MIGPINVVHLLLSLPDWRCSLPLSTLTVSSVPLSPSSLCRTSVGLTRPARRVSCRGSGRTAYASPHARSELSHWICSIVARWPEPESLPYINSQSPIYLTRNAPVSPSSSLTWVHGRVHGQSAAPPPPPPPPPPAVKCPADWSRSVRSVLTRQTLTRLGHSGAVYAATPDTWAEKFESFERINSMRDQTKVSTHVCHVNGWDLAVYMMYVTAHVSGVSLCWRCAPVSSQHKTWCGSDSQPVVIWCNSFSWERMWPCILFMGRKLTYLNNNIPIKDT